MRNWFSLLFFFSWSASLFDWLSFFLFFFSLVWYEPSFIISRDLLGDFWSFLILCNAFKIFPYFLLILLHGYHSFPLLLSYIFYLFDCHDSYFFNMMIHFLIVQWLHYCVTYDHFFQLFLTFFLRKNLMTFLVDQINWLVSGA